MKKIVSLIMIICFVMAAGTGVYANSTEDGSVASVDAQSSDGTVMITVYNLELIAKEHFLDLGIDMSSDESETDSAGMNERVAQRAKDAIIIQIENYAAVANDLLEWIDKDNKKVVPYIKENRTMVPLRYIAEKLGAEVGYDEEKREVSITLGEDVFKVVIDDTKYTLNGEEYPLDAPAEIVENRTFVPLRVISEAFNKKVNWIEAGRYVIITPEFYPWAEENAIEKETLSRISLMVSPLVRDLVYSKK